MIKSITLQNLLAWSWYYEHYAASAAAFQQLKRLACSAHTNEKIVAD